MAAEKNYFIKNQQFIGFLVGRLFFDQLVIDAAGT